jgi:hypothetical protein
MPQLFSRMDDANWLTPSIADILDQGATPPGGDGSIRQFMLQLQEELGTLGTPARIVNVRPTPSYTLYVARPDAVGRLGNRRAVPPSEIRRSLGKIAEQHKDWTLGFLPQLQEDQEAVGILLRTQQHQPVSLRRMLVRGAFRDNASPMAVVLGITLEQQLIVGDMAKMGSLLVVGSENAKQHFIRSLLLTLTLLNTPSELRLALVGQSSEAYKPLAEIPHALGRLLLTPADGQRLLDGLIKEVQRRQQWFQENGVESIEVYNASLKEQNKLQLPHILLVIDSLSDPTWQSAHDQWTPSLLELVKSGVNTGIYLVVAINKLEDSEIPDSLAKGITTQIVMRSVSSFLNDRMKNFHGSLLRFVDAFAVDNTEEDEPVPVELCAVTPDEVQRAIAYWRQAAIQRKQETQMAEVSGKTGVTGLLRPVETTETPAELPTPPIPEKPTSDTLVRATQALAGDEHSFAQAQALAAYLGWLGVGPLHDVLGLSLGEAHIILTRLQAMGVLESSESPTPRFVRLIGVKPEDTQ